MPTTQGLIDEGSGSAFPTLFSQIHLGAMKLRNRAMLPPRGSAIGNLFGTQSEADRCGRNTLSMFGLDATKGVKQ